MSDRPTHRQQDARHRLDLIEWQLNQAETVEDLRDWLRDYVLPVLGERLGA